MNDWKSHFRMKGAAAGALLTLLLTLGLLGLGGWLVYRDLLKQEEPAAGSGIAPVSAERPAPPAQPMPDPLEPLTGPPQLEAAAAYVPQNDIIEVDISEYGGYGGLIVANGGLEPNPASFFARNYGFRVKLSLSEGENWSQLNNGRFAASATTADVLAVLGRQFQVVVPVQIGFSRGADMVVVDRGIASINQLAGKVLAASQFNESEFFIRYLAQEADLRVKVLRDLDGRPGPGELGLVFYEDAFAACDAYAHELARPSPRLNGCVGWTPRTDELVENAAGLAKVLVSNRNLLVIADILCVNKGFAQAHPEMVRGLVHGLLEGNRLLREQPDSHVAVVAKAFAWTEQQARDELSRVHLANLPENLAFFSGTIDAAGSFGSLFQSAVLVYGDILKNPADPDRFLDLAYLKALQAEGRFAQQQVAIAPIRLTARQALEGEALLSKDIRFFFEANSAALDQAAQENLEYLDTVKRFLQVSPGSMVLLRGHVDNAKIPEFRREGGEKLVQVMALKAMELSRQRALAVRAALIARHQGLDPQRIEAVGRGWEEPAGTVGELNRRVEVQWFTLE